MDSEKYIDELYSKRESLVKYTKNPYQSPNVIHRKIFWQRIYTANRLIAKYVTHFDSVLDFGTHEGVILPSLLSQFNKVYSLELIEERANKDFKGRMQAELVDNMLDYFEFDRKKIEYVNIEPTDQELPILKDKSLDCIIATDVLEHVPNLPTLMETFKRVLKPGGNLVISIPLEGTMYRLGVWLNNLVFKMGNNRDFHINEAKDIDKLLRGNFEVLEIKSLYGLFRFYVLRKRD